MADANLKPWSADIKTDKLTDGITPISKGNSIGQTVFELDSGNRNVEGQTNGQKTDKRMDRVTPISKGT